MLRSCATGLGKSVDMWMCMGYPPLSTFRGFWVGVSSPVLFYTCADRGVPRFLVEEGTVIVLAANACVEALFLTLYVVLTVGVLSGEGGRREKVLFSLTFVLNACGTLGIFLFWLFRRRADLFSMVCARAGLHVAYLTGPLAMTLCVLLACRLLCEDLDVFRQRVLDCVVVAVYVACLVLLVCNFWNGWVFRIDESNVFSFGPLHSVPEILSMLQIAVSLLAVLFAGKEDRYRAGMHWLAIFTLPISSGIFEEFYPTLLLVYPGTAFSMLMMYLIRKHMLEERRIHAERELEENRAKLYMEQLNPHFIFNSLTAIQELCLNDSDKARESVQNLSTYLRGNIDAISKDRMVPLRKAIGHVKSYLSLEQDESQRRIDVKWNLRKLNVMLPPLSLQAAVEHMVKYHLPYSDQPKLVISVTSDGSDDFVSVKDNVPPSMLRERSSDECLDGILGKVDARLRLSCEGRIEAHGESDGTVLTIIVPIGGGDMS